MLPEVKIGFDTQCSRCGKNFERAHQSPLTWGLACALSGLVFYVILVTAPFLEVALYDRFRLSTVTTGLHTLESEGFSIVACVVLITALLMPLFKLCGLTIVLASLHLKQPPRWIVPLFRHLKFVHTWSMAEIFLLGFLVAYTRLQTLVHVHMEIAVFALIGLVLSMVSIDTMLAAETVWKKIREKGLTRMQEGGEAQGAMIGCRVCHQANAADAANCLRCDAILEPRRPNSLARTWALLISALILYIPANIFAILHMTKFPHTQSYTILHGVEDFLHAGLWPLALLVFTASIAIPLFKLIALIFLLASTQSKSRTYLIIRTRLYRFIDFIGRWSMIDTFMLSILVGLVQFGKLAQVTSGPGAIYFAAVVILTILATSSFDPRLMWDAAEDQSSKESTPR